MKWGERCKPLWHNLNIIEYDLDRAFEDNKTNADLKRS